MQPLPEDILELVDAAEEGAIKPRLVFHEEDTQIVIVVDADKQYCFDEDQAQLLFSDVDYAHQVIECLEIQDESYVCLNNITLPDEVYDVFDEAFDRILE